MKKAEYNCAISTEKILKELGLQIKNARLRRLISAQLVADRAGISRSTLWKVEAGNPAVAMGNYAAVLHAINGLDKDLLLVAKDEELKNYQMEKGIICKKRATRGSYGRKKDFCI